MKKQLSGYVETAKTVVMILLFACVLCLLAVYIALLSNTWSPESAYGDAVDEIRLLASGGDTSDYPSGMYLMPSSVLLRTEETSRILLQNGEGVMEDCYVRLAPLITAAASDTSCLRPLYGREATETWQQVSLLPSCIYVSYHLDLPLQIVGYFSAALTEQAMLVTSATPVLVKEMVFYEDEAGDCQVLIRSSAGTVYLSETRSDASTFSDLYAYSVYELEKEAKANASYSDATFAGAYFAEEDPFVSPVTPVLLSGLRAAKYRFTTPDLTSLLSDQKDANNFLRLFSYNPNKINRHEEANGTTVYVEEHGVLKISSTSLSYTAAQGGGVSAAEALEADASGIDLYDAVLYSTRILDGLRAIRPGYFGGDCQLLLTSVSGESGNLELRYRYYADNLPLRGPAPEILFTFTSDTMTSVVIEGLTGYNVADPDHLYSGAWVAERFHASFGTLKSLTVVYDYQTGKSVSAQWIAVAEEADR